jgi:isocitrate dehydrogenase
MPNETNNLLPLPAKITVKDGALSVPPHPIIPFIEGDGSGPDIWRVARPVLDAAVQKAYRGARQVAWLEVLAGQKAYDRLGHWLPEDTITAYKEYRVGIKGPLATPVGGGMRSLNVALRTILDLYVCLRPVRWFKGVPSPVRRPELVDMVIFRENTEDLYTGIEFEQGTDAQQRFLQLLQEHFPDEFNKIPFPTHAGIGIKTVSREGTQRLVRAAIRWALENQRKSLTLVHKGNIMKYTEGAFRKWGYALAEEEFGGQVYTRLQWERTRADQGEAAANAEQAAALAAGRLLIKDAITDAAFEMSITRPAELDVLATTNLNGDYLSDALAAQVGGVGIAPGANINYETSLAIFEATHGTAPTLAGLDKANPSSVILSGEMLLRHLGWHEAADLVIQGLEGAFAARTMTFDLCQLDPEASLLKTSEFGRAVIQHMGLDQGWVN